jgi:RimJ/RimL family protein N-acetyltransferase
VHPCRSALAGVLVIGHSGAMPALHPASAEPLRNVTTERLSLRRIHDDDLNELAVIFADSNVWQFEQGRGLTEAESEAFLARQKRLWVEFSFGGCAVRDLRNRNLIGVVGLGVSNFEHQLLPPVTIGWRFSSKAWGHGYATEAATALLHQAFGAMELDQVGCVTNPANGRSVALARRLGMNVMTEVAVPRDDGNGTVVAVILMVSRNAWRSVHDS